MTREEELLDRIDEQKRYIKSLEAHIEGLQEKLSDTQKELEKHTTEDIDTPLPEKDEDVFNIKVEFEKMKKYEEIKKKYNTQPKSCEDWDLADEEKPSKPMMCNMSDDELLDQLDSLDDGIERLKRKLTS
jgi:hypothetical protein